MLSVTPSDRIGNESRTQKEWGKSGVYFLNNSRPLDRRGNPPWLPGHPAQFRRDRPPCLPGYPVQSVGTGPRACPDTRCNPPVVAPDDDGFPPQGRRGNPLWLPAPTVGARRSVRPRPGIQPGPWTQCAVSAQTDRQALSREGRIIQIGIRPEPLCTNILNCFTMISDYIRLWVISHPWNMRKTKESLNPTVHQSQYTSIPSVVPPDIPRPSFRHSR